MRRALLGISIGVSLSLLIYFKYARFLADSAVFGLNLAEAHLKSPTWDIILPLGFSFYTFETISYVVDAYRSRVVAARNILDYALYILPKLAVIEITPDSVARRNRTLDYTITRQFPLSDICENFADIFHSTNKAISRVLSSRLLTLYTHRLCSTVMGSRIVGASDQ